MTIFTLQIKQIFKTSLFSSITCVLLFSITSVFAGISIFSTISTISSTTAVFSWSMFGSLDNIASSEIYVNSC